MLVNREHRIMNYRSNNNHSTGSFSEFSIAGSPFSSDGSNWDSCSALDTPVNTPTRHSFDFITMGDLSNCTTTPVCTPKRFRNDTCFSPMTENTQDIHSGFHDPSMRFVSIDKLATDASMMCFDGLPRQTEFRNYNGHRDDSFGSQSSLYSQSFNGDSLSPLSEMDSSPSKGFVVPSQTTFMESFDMTSPARPIKALHFNMRYDSPMVEYDSPIQVVSSPTDGFSPTYNHYAPSFNGQRAASVAPSRPSPPRQPIPEPLPSSTALHRVQQQTAVGNHGQLPLRQRKQSKRGQKSGLLADSITIQKQPRKLCPYAGCVKKFARLEHLKRHEKTHLKGPGAEAHPCIFCEQDGQPKIFNRADNLKAHVRLHFQTPKKSSRTTYHPEALEYYLTLKRKSPAKDVDIGREVGSSIRTKSRRVAF